MFFYLIASPGPAWHAWLLLGAWVLWSFYAGHNVCLPNLSLKLAPVQEKSPYVAANEAVASLFHGVITLIGGFLFDWLNDSQTSSRLASAAMNPYVIIFSVALVLRLAAVPLAMALVEPGAWTWREILHRHTAATASAEGSAA